MDEEAQVQARKHFFWHFGSLDSYMPDWEEPSSRPPAPAVPARPAPTRLAKAESAQGERMGGSTQHVPEKEIMADSVPRSGGTGDQAAKPENLVTIEVEDAPAWMYNRDQLVQLLKAFGLAGVRDGSRTKDGEALADGRFTPVTRPGGPEDYQVRYQVSIRSDRAGELLDRLGHLDGDIQGLAELKRRFGIESAKSTKEPAGSETAVRHRDESRARTELRFDAGSHSQPAARPRRLSVENFEIELRLRRSRVSGVQSQPATTRPVANSRPSNE